METQVKVKGSGIGYTKEYIVKKYGKETMDRIMSFLPEDAAATVQNAIPSAWYPIEHMGHLTDGIKRVVGAKERYAVFEISRESAKTTFSTLYKIFFKLGNPSFIMDRVASVWRNMASEGDLSVVERGDKFVVVRLSNFPYRHPDYCGHRLRGWFHAVLELSGCEITKSKHTKCTSNNDSHCEWRFEWK